MEVLEETFQAAQPASRDVGKPISEASFIAHKLPVVFLDVVSGIAELAPHEESLAVAEMWKGFVKSRLTKCDLGFPAYLRERMLITTLGYARHDHNNSSESAF